MKKHFLGKFFLSDILSLKLCLEMWKSPVRAGWTPGPAAGKLPVTKSLFIYIQIDFDMKFFKIL